MRESRRTRETCHRQIDGEAERETLSHTAESIVRCGAAWLSRESVLVAQSVVLLGCGIGTKRC